jgi:hypothetical protein
VEDGEHRVRLAATKRRLELNDWIAAAVPKALYDALEQETHPLGDDRALKELHRVLVLGRGDAEDDLGQVGGKRGFLEMPIEDILVGTDNFTPGLQNHFDTSSEPSRQNISPA